MKTSKKFLTLAALFVMGGFFIAHSVDAATILSTDSFGSSSTDNVPNWTDGGGDENGDTYVTSGTSRAGSATPENARVRDGGYITRTISTVGYTNIVLKYYWRGDDDGDGNSDNLKVYWKKSSDSTYLSINTHQLDGNDSWSSQTSINLPVSADNTSIDIKFLGDSNSDSEEGRIDDISLEGTVIDLTAPVTTDNVDGNWHNSSQVITLTCSDAGSGCDKTYYTTDGSTPTTSSTQGNTITLSIDGIYTIKYFSKDLAGNTETVKTATNQGKVDTTNPVVAISTHPADPTNATSGSFTYTITEANLASQTCKIDDIDTTSCTTTSASFSGLTEGAHTFVVTATDLAGNTGSATFTWTIDITAPTIASHADIPLEATSSAGAIATYTSPNATDIIDGTLLASCLPVSGSTFALGTNVVTCNKTDSAGNVATPTTFNVIVSDTTAPVIAVDGSNPQTILVGQSYVELGATVNDNYDTGLSATINASAVNTSVLGSYVVTYDAVDAHSNIAVQKTRTVNVVDQEAPVITLVGANPQIIEVHTAYTELGATVADNYDSGLIATINASAVNTSVVGTYQVTYNVTDTSENSAMEVVRTVNVVDTTVPTIVLTGDSDITLEVDSAPYVDAGATANDNYDASVPVSTSDTVNVNTIGDYVLHYNHTDANGNSALEVTRTVHVTPHDTTPNEFTFVDQTDVALNTVIESAPVTITGISTEVSISITGGEYSINGGEYTSEAGTIANNDEVKVRHTSSAINNTSVDTVLTVSTASDTFTSTTLPLTHTLTYLVVANGSISGNASQTVIHGQDGTTVTAVGDPGYHFVNWSSESTQNPRTDLNVTSSISVTANFTTDPSESNGAGGGSITPNYTITVTAGAGGTASPIGATVVSYATDRTFTFTPDSGFHVADVIVDGTSVGTLTAYTFDSVKADHTIAVTFAEGQVLGTETTASSSGGKVLIGDLNHDGTVDGLDAIILVGQWGATSGEADINNDGTVNEADFALLMANWS